MTLFPKRSCKTQKLIYIDLFVIAGQESETQFQGLEHCFYDASKMNRLQKRKCLLTVNPQSNLFYLVPQLKLPPPIGSYILLDYHKRLTLAEQIIHKNR